MLFRRVWILANNGSEFHGAMRTSHWFIKNAAATVFSHISRLIAGIFLPPYVISCIGVDGYGLTVMVSSVLTFLTLLQLGVPQATVRYLSENISKDDFLGVNKVYNSSLAILGAVSVVVAVVVLWINYNYEILGKTGIELTSWEVRSTVLILGAAAVLSVPLMIFESCVIARREFIAYASIQSFITVFRVLVVILVLHIYSEKLFAYVMVAAVFTIMPYLAVMCWQKFNNTNLIISFTMIDTETVKRLIKHGSIVSASVIAWLFMTNFNNLIIGKFLGAKQLAMYSLALVWSGLLQGVSTSISQVLLSDAAGRSVAGDYEYIRMLAVRSSKFILVGFSPAIVFLAIFRNEIMTTWLGPGFEDAASIMVPILVGEIFTVINSPVANIVIVTGMAKYAAKFNMLLAVISACTLFIGVYYLNFEIVDVAIMYGMVFFIRGGIIYPYIFTRCVNVSILKYYTEVYMRPLFSLLAIVVITMTIYNNTMIVHSWFQLITYAIIVGFVGAIAGYLIGLDIYDRKVVCGLIIDKFKKAGVR